MKKDKIIYWTSTVLVMLMGALPAFTYFAVPKMVEGFKHVGFPDYFRIELAIGKLMGLIIILLPAIPSRIKEWAYVAFGITFISAAIAHGVVDGIALIIMPVIAFTLLGISYVYYHKLKTAKKLSA
jgi:hypothetical protein